MTLPSRAQIPAIGFLLLACLGCDECDYEGQTWCDDDRVMICHYRADDGDLREDSYDDAGDGALIIGELLAELFETTDDVYAAEVSQDCAAYDEVCKERTADGETTAYCGHD